MSPIRRERKGFPHLLIGISKESLLAAKLLKDNGIPFLTIPLGGFPRPELFDSYHTYRGIEEIKDYIEEEKEAV